MFDVGSSAVREGVARALAEDIGSGDVTTELTVPPGLLARGTFLAKQDFIAAGLELLPLVFELGGGGEREGTRVDLLCTSGAAVTDSMRLATVQGPARVLLACERVALNYLQRLSGVATLASRYAGAVAGTKARVLDTRKTTPGLRDLEKMAAAAGGVTNHRRGLYDAVLVKNNHITAAGGVAAALAAVRAFPGTVEIEVRTREELDEALRGGAKHVLLDNLTPAEAAEWIRIIDGRAIVELSGGITLETIRAYAEAGPDYISAGAITHSATAVDISFRLELLDHAD